MRKHKPTRSSALKQVFDGYIEDTITDEQIWRVLEPIVRMIKQGAFDRPRRFSIFRERKRA